jgi:hypothetical protein
MREVEIHPAHVWTCEDCGRDNFERSIAADFLTPEEYRGLCEEMGIFDPAIDAEPPEGAIVAAPENVECRYCHGQFKTVEPNETRD